MQDFSQAVQRHQDWYESQTVDVVVSGDGIATEVEAPVGFSKGQLRAMRAAFQANDGLITNGELLLAYPDRIERNEEVTRQYHEMSRGMACPVSQSVRAFVLGANPATDH